MNVKFDVDIVINFIQLITVNMINLIFAEQLRQLEAFFHVIISRSLSNSMNTITIDCFFRACAEFFGMCEGHEYLVSHYLFVKP